MARWMAGEAEYQVGLELLQAGEKAFGGEASHADITSAGHERGEKGAEPVDMKERHHSQASVGGSSCKAEPMLSADRQSCRCVSGASLGRAVVPDVNSNSAGPLAAAGPW